ncbi:MAG: hypothetical protein ACI8P3_000368 [Saprospiraceae bacterium]|jgi:hypothetical protein
MVKFLFSLIGLCFLISPIVAQQTVGLFLNDPTAYNGYTLITPEYTSTYLIDNCGHVVNNWEADQRPGSVAYLLENGNLLRTGRANIVYNAGGSGGRIELFNWEGDLIWRYDYTSTDFHQHHDVAALPNGNILVLAWEYHSIQDAEDNGRAPDLISNLGVWSEQIVELQPVGSDEANIVWKWSLWDHLIQHIDSTKTNYGIISEHPELVDLNFEANAGGGVLSGPDWIHLNAINYNADLDQIVVSSRHFDEFWIIDHSTTTGEAASGDGGNSGKGGDILYRWGNPQSYGRGVGFNRKLFGQHDVQWISPGLPDEGKILIFNNGLERAEGLFSSIDIIDPPIANDGSYFIEEGLAFGPENLFSTYKSDPPEDFYSSNLSGVQRLPNGNTLICDGRRGRVFEITPDHKIAWEYQCPVRIDTGPIDQEIDISNVPTPLFRATRYGADYPAFEGKELIPGDPIELNPIAYDCTIYENTTAIFDHHVLENVTVIGNPVFNTLKIKNDSEEPIHLEIFDIRGKLLSSSSSPENIFEKDVKHLAPGMYIARISNITSNKFYNTKFIKL